MSRRIFLSGKGKVKKVSVGGGSAISVQSMWKKSLKGANAKTLNKIAQSLSELEFLGLQIMRFAVPDLESAELLKKLSLLTSVPLIADIHFDYKLALACMDGNLGGVRINPGNIGGAKKVKAVVEKAKATETPLRIGVNSGSLPKDLNKLPKHEALVKASEREMELFEDLGFSNYAVSLKSSDVETTVQANKLFVKKYKAPLHLGITEAGPAIAGTIKSAIGFYRLLSEGIGDTIRVSLSDTCEKEVIAGVEILRACGKLTEGVKIISCPRCGRNGFDVHGFLKRWQTDLYKLNKNVKIAIMGCAVNGPGEAKQADLGITGGENFAVIFKQGKVVQNLKLDNLTATEKNKIVDEAFENELKSL